MMGMDQMMLQGEQYKFCIPLHCLSSFFQYGRLIPSVIASGLKISITLKQPKDVFTVVNLGSVTDPSLQPGGGTNGPHHHHATNDTAFLEKHQLSVRDYVIDEVYFNLSSIQLSDSIQRAIAVISSHNGLELVYTDYEYHAHNIKDDKEYINIGKSCSRALQAIARVRVTNDDMVGPGTPYGLDGETGFPVISYQWRLGSLYFPQQPVRGHTTDQCAVEAYAHCLEAFEKFHTNAKQPMNAFRHKHKAMEHLLDSAHFGHLYSSKGHIPPLPYNANQENHELGTWKNDSHVIAVNLERSSLFNLAGVPLNNSRSLALDIELSPNTSQPSKTLDGETNATKQDSLNISRNVVVYLKYVKLARCFLNNIEIEQ